MRTKFKKLIIDNLYIVYKIIRAPILFIQKRFNIKTQGVRVLVISQNKILLVKHWYNGMYVMPGGGIKKSETPEYAGIREVKEETGFEINQLDYLLGVYSNTTGGKNDTVYCYVILLEEKPLVQNKFNIEIADLDWFDIDALPASISSSTKKRIQEYQNHEITNELRIW